MMNRRELLLRGSAWMGAAAFAVGCSSTKGFGFGTGGRMATWADRPLTKLRIGIIGLGRGEAAFNSFPSIPNCVITAICDLNRPRIDIAIKKITEVGGPMPKVYTGGQEEWKRLCDDPEVDLVWNATPWEMHVPVSLYAMRAGKHVAIEVPAAFTVDECWELVETSEELQRHCMQLENCCYGEEEMLTLNLCRAGKFGQLVHGEGAYIHSLGYYCYGDWNDQGDNRAADGNFSYWNYWRLRHNAVHKGNQYPTHGLGPICWYMDVNRGDRFDYLVSLESDQFNYEAYAKGHFPDNAWKRDLRVEMGDMNCTLIKTVRGRSILVQHDVSSPRPYTRLNVITGTRGSLLGYPLRITLAERDGEHGRQLSNDEVKRMREEFKHPLWKQMGEMATKVGGHGGMDFLMCLRVAYCLQNGLPLDQNVYDLASWCSLCELTEKSVRNRSQPMDVPDFTRGAWRDTAPLGDLSVDLAKMGLA